MNKIILILSLMSFSVAQAESLSVSPKKQTKPAVKKVTGVPKQKREVASIEEVENHSAVLQYSLGYNSGTLVSRGITEDVGGLVLGLEIKEAVKQSFQLEVGLRSSLIANPQSDKTFALGTLGLEIGTSWLINKEWSVSVAGNAGMGYVYFKQPQKTMSQINGLNGLVFVTGFSSTVNYKMNKDYNLGLKIEQVNALINSESKASFKGVAPTLVLEYKF